MSTTELDRLFARYPALTACGQEMTAALRLCEDCFAAGNRLLICGNGGSAADAEHIVGELMKSYRKPRPVSEQLRRALANVDPDDGPEIADRLQAALPAISLCGHPSLASAYANDVAPELVFAQQVYGYGRPGDLLLAISTSGNSRNVVAAALVARARDLQTVGLTGAEGGRLYDICDVTIRAPAHETPEVQELHMPIYHWLCEALEARFF